MWGLAHDCPKYAYNVLKVSLTIRRKNQDMGAPHLVAIETWDCKLPVEIGW